MSDYAKRILVHYFKEALGPKFDSDAQAEIEMAIDALRAEPVQQDGLKVYKATIHLAVIADDEVTAGSGIGKLLTAWVDTKDPNAFVFDWAYATNDDYDSYATPKPALVNLDDYEEGELFKDD